MSIWASGSPYEAYVGRWSRLVAQDFLAWLAVPRGSRWLDIGCGTGNFLAAARDAGFRVSGTELDRNAACFAKEKLGLQRVLPLTISEFAERYVDERLDVVTFFEVLEHQVAPAEFLQKVKECVRPGGVIAMSVPNRDRWLTAPDVLDYPPNHFLRWNAAALAMFLNARGFEVLSIREQPAGLTTSFRDMMQMTPDQAEAVLQGKLTKRQRVMEVLGRIKYAACFALAAAAYPYVRMRGLKGTYLYCLARKCD